MIRFPVRLISMALKHLKGTIMIIHLGIANICPVINQQNVHGVVKSLILRMSKAN